MKTLITKIAKITSGALLLATLTSGCAVKNTDNMATKAAKHTVNAPGYVLIGTGYVLTQATTLVLAGTIGSVAYVGRKAKEGVTSLVTDTPTPSFE